jgi:outer membrane protein OmpA-like peptidoglycan-associated protein
MVTKTLIILVFIFSTVQSYAQSPDTVVTAQGRIINAETKQPVFAKIVYESLPYGNITGVIHNTQYSFLMFEKARYSITVEASGFTPAKYMLDPAEANDMKLTKDIELVLGPIAEKKKPVPGSVIPLNNLIFEITKSKIEPESYAQLDNVVEMMVEYPKMVIQLEGHTDFLGNDKKNLKLSQDRVEAVKEYLVKKGISKSRVKTAAYGGTRPLSREDTPEAHRLNRRVELRILEN